MKFSQIGRLMFSLAAVLWLAACESGSPGPSSALDREPTLAEKAEAERANKVAVRGASNVQATTQVSRTNGASALAAATAPSVQPISRAGAVSPDIVLVDAEPLCSAEVLYPLREQIAKSRTQTTRTGFIEDLYRAVRRQAQEEIGRILMFRGASAKFSDAQKTALDGFVKRELNQRVEREFDGSHARFELHLKEHGLTLDQYKAAQRRQIVVQQELYETIVPQLRLRRDELLAFYREHQDQYVQPESRELWMIEAPFERFLPEWLTWARADAAAQAQARLKTVRHIREAHTALSESTFAEVAMKYCRGVHASEGGAWGPIGKPLQAPYDLVSSPIFKFSEEQVSDPIETALGWCIVKCGKITPQRVVPFDEVQDEIRKAMMDERFATLAGEHVRRLAERASISSFEAFVSETVRLVATNSWPRSADGVE